MSREYRELTGKTFKRTSTDEMRKHSQRPGVTDDQGNPVYMTEQAHKKECDINEIIRKYDKQGLITHVTKMEAKFGDATGLEYRQAWDLVHNATESFNQLPSKIRNRFENNPEKFLNFFENPDNRAEAISLGLISETTPPDQDGLGEWVKSDGTSGNNESGNLGNSDGKSEAKPSISE